MDQPFLLLGKSPWYRQQQQATVNNQIHQGLQGRGWGALGNFWPRFYDINLISKRTVDRRPGCPQPSGLWPHSISDLQELSPTGACVHSRWQSSGVRAFQGVHTYFLSVLWSFKINYGKWLRVHFKFILKVKIILVKRK